MIEATCAIQGLRKRGVRGGGQGGYVGSNVHCNQAGGAAASNTSRRERISPCCCVTERQQNQQQAGRSLWHLHPWPGRHLPRWAFHLSHLDRRSSHPFPCRGKTVSFRRILLKAESEAQFKPTIRVGWSVVLEDLSEEGRTEIRIRRARIHVVQRVAGLNPELKTIAARSLAAGVRSVVDSDSR